MEMTVGIHGAIFVKHLDEESGDKELHTPRQEIFTLKLCTRPSTVSFTLKGFDDGV
jgi:hypothetical protein